MISTAVTTAVTIKDSLYFLEGYCKFSPNEVYVLIGMLRNKDNNLDKQVWMRRLILRSIDDIANCYHDIKVMGDRKGVTYRMYVSQNSRDVTKALFNFQPELIKVGYDLVRNNEQTKQAVDRIKRIDSMWKTELLQNRNRGTKRFLLDVDTQKLELIEAIKQYLGNITQIHAIRPTVSGYHIVFDACDTREFMQKFKDNPIEIQRDSLVFIETWEGQI